LNGYANILRILVNYAVTFDVIEESPFKKPLAREKVNLPKNELTDDERAAFLSAFNDRAAFLAHLRAKHRTGNVVSCARYPTPRAFGGNRRWDSPTAEVLWSRVPRPASVLHRRAHDRPPTRRSVPPRVEGRAVERGMDSTRDGEDRARGGGADRRGVRDSPPRMPRVRWSASSCSWTKPVCRSP
jgi:hypothetical protein